MRQHASLARRLPRKSVDHALRGFAGASERQREARARVGVSHGVSNQPPDPKGSTPEVEKKVGGEGGESYDPPHSPTPGNLAGRLARGNLNIIIIMASTKQSAFEWTAKAKPSTTSRPLSPQMLSKFGKLLTMIGEADLAAKLPKRFAITDWDSKLSQSVKAKLTKLKRELDKHPSHRRKAAYSKSISVLMDRFAKQESSDEPKAKAKPKAKQASKPKAEAKAEPKAKKKPEASEDERTMAIAIALAKALKGLI